MASLLSHFHSVKIGLTAFASHALCHPPVDVRVIIVRTKQIHVPGKIRGHPRPCPHGKIQPEPKKYGWRPILPADGKYTVRSLDVQKLGGRDPETGRVVVKTIGGGQKKIFYWVDYKREGPKEGEPFEERVFEVKYDTCRTAYIALVACDDPTKGDVGRRWIIAHENMKVGDVIRSYGDIPRIPVRPNIGDAHPLGALPIGTIVHNIEKLPGQGGNYCRAAGASAQVLRKTQGQVIIKLPSKEEVSLSEECVAVIGKVYQPEIPRKPIGSPQLKRWMGKRQRSGCWHRKDGYCGRKIHPPKPLKVITDKVKETPEMFQFNL